MATIQSTTALKKITYNESSHLQLLQHPHDQMMKIQADFWQLARNININSHHTLFLLLLRFSSPQTASYQRLARQKILPTFWWALARCSFMSFEATSSSHSGQTARNRMQWASWREKFTAATSLLLGMKEKNSHGQDHQCVWNFSFGKQTDSPFYSFETNGTLGIHYIKKIGTC